MAWLSSCALLLCLACPEALSAHEAEHTHPALAAASLELMGDSSVFGVGQKALLLQGTIEEDSPFWNVLYHFYNPGTGQNHVTGFAGETARAKAEPFWRAARNGYFPNSTENFRSLGSVLHLLQDMTSPAHVHDDAHVGISTGCGFGGSIDDFERWGWCSATSSNRILGYVTPVTGTDGQVIGGSMTQDMKGLLTGFLGYKPVFPIDLSPGGFIHDLATRTYNFTTYFGILTAATSQETSELQEMFPSLTYSYPGLWEISDVGKFNGVCGGPQAEDWWAMEVGCVVSPGTVLGSFYIENSGGNDNDLTPAVWKKKGAHPVGDNDLSLLQIYGDNLYPLATAYGAGLLKVFEEVVKRPAHFTDVRDNDWFEGYVRYMYLQGVIQGYSDGTFRPDATATRAEVLQMAYRAAGETIKGNAPNPGFADVKLNDWFYSLVADAKEKGFVNGEACGIQQCFRPNDPINRAEAAKIVSTVLRVDIDHPEHIVNHPRVIPFPDVDASDWFYRYVYWLANSKVKNGFPDLGLVSDAELLIGYEDGLFHPERLITRGQIAKLLTHAMLYCRASTSTAQCGPDAVISNGFQRLSASSAGSAVTTLGALYEQVSDPANTNGPGPFHLPGGDSRTVTAPLTITGDTHDADGDPLFYFWTVDGGSLTTSDSMSFSKVTWTPPVVAMDTVFNLHVVRGDRRGLIGTGRFELLVPGTGSADPAAGTITSPNGTQTGLVTVAATASDGDGLARVTVTFISQGPELVLCGPDGPAACTGTGGTWSRSGVGPAAFGASSGSVTMRLFVEDATGEVVLVDTHAFTFSPPPTGPTYKLTIRKEGDGSGTVSGGGVVCGPGCSTTVANLPAGSSVTLTGSAAAGSVWVGFGGERCYGPDPCTLTMNTNITLHAAFGLPDAFAIRYTSPSNGDTGVATSAQINVYFNRDIATGPNQAGLVLRESGGTPVPFTPVIRSTDRRLVLIPSSSLAPGKSYVVEIPAGAVSDTGGTPLATPWNFIFTTAVAGAPKMYISGYPPHVMEGSETKVSIWFESPSSQERTIALTSTPAGELIHPSEVILEAGKTLVELQVDSRYNHGSTSPVTVTFSASTPGVGQQSVQIIVANNTSIFGSSLRWQAASVVDDTDKDGVFEADEIAEIRFEVANFGSSTISNVVLEFSVINAYGISILGGAPYTCNLGSLGAGKGTNCTRSFRANDDLPTDDYYIEVKGTSSANSFLDQARVHIVNNLQPDFVLHAGSFTSAELTPGSTVNVQYTARNDTDGFSSELPLFEVTLEIEGTSQVLYRVHANARGYVWNEQTFKLPIVVPPVPGAHTIRARINPPGTGRLLESNYANNDAPVLTLHVAAPNQPPALNPIPGPLAAQAGRALAFTATATDPNNNPITYRLAAGAPAGASIGSTSGVFTWTPACSQGPASYSLAIVADDSKGGTDTETFTANVGIETDLGAAQIAGSEWAVPGQTVGLTIVATNGGPSCATGAALAAIFPAALSGVSWTCTASAGSSCAAGGTGNIGDLSLSLLQGGTATYAVTAKVTDTASGLVFSSSTVTAPAGAVDPNGTNNGASATITLRGLDFGDAPAAFPTRLAQNGARHGIDPGLRLGATLDAEPDGQPDPEAHGDDSLGARDEDGVVFPAQLVPCGTADVQVTASAAGLLSAWIDFNADGDWSDAGEGVAVNRALAAGVNAVPVAIPCGARPDATAFARFRFSSAGNLGVSGLALDGEVEDHAVVIGRRPLDFYTVTPCRILDTRSNGQPLASGVKRIIQVAGLCGIPADAGAVSVNVTAVAPSSAGYIVLFPGNESVPAASSISFKSGSTRANNAILLLATDATGTLAAQASLAGGGQVHLVIDVYGFFK
jgi:uncharacterized repeat protein (TIGR01451 family)